MKKSQVVMSFNYLTAVIIIGVILIFGTMSIIKLTDNIEKIESETFRRDFQNSIESVGGSLHSIQYVELSGLTEFSKLCFFDYPDRVTTVAENPPILQNFTTIIGDLKETEDNIFLFKGEIIAEKFSYTKIVIEEGYVCVDISPRGTIDLKLEGMGRTVRLEVD